jgi:cyclin-dependent kinase inhibitor 3
MAAPEDVHSFHQQVIVVIDDFIGKGGSAVVHCRGGIGRAGTVTACYLAFKQQLKANESIEIIRQKRDWRCVESRKQEDFVVKYCEFLRGQRLEIQVGL